MSGGHHHQLYLEHPSPVHRLPPQCKIAATVLFVVAVVCTPRGEAGNGVWWPYAMFALALAVVAVLARVPAGTILRRMVIETPFVLFAVILPFAASGPRTHVLGVSVSEVGLHGAGILLAKGTLGVVASILLAATTHQRDLLLGLQRLRMPQLLVQIMTFMFRYVDVVTGEMRRMRVARESRGFQARHLGHLRVVAQSGGALFIRCYERGERVHLAMLSRGYDGQLPQLFRLDASRGQWLAVSTLPLFAVLVVAVAWLPR